MVIIAYTDLKFILHQNEPKGIQSHFQGLISPLRNDEEFISSINNFKYFEKPMSYYVNLAKEKIIKEESDEVPLGAKDLILDTIMFNYFDRPQNIKISFIRYSTLERSEMSKHSKLFWRKIDAEENTFK